MTAPDLKPCPFCGGENVTTAFDPEQGDKWGYAGCDGCAARGPEVRTGYEREHDAPWHTDAIAAWNTRTTPLAEALAVPEVAALVEAAKDRLHWLDEDTGEYCGCGACEPLYAALVALGAIEKGAAE